MKINLEISELELKDLILDYFQQKLGDIVLDKQSLEIMVKSRKNFKSEWEVASFKAVYDSTNQFKSDPKPQIVLQG